MKLKEDDKEKLMVLLRAYEEKCDDMETRYRQFKHICRKHLPQGGDGYVANKNVFDIQDKTIEDIHKDKVDMGQLVRMIIKNT